MNESYKQIYATEKYVDDAINLTSQADWDQNDSTASDYIKNKPFYSESQKDDEDQRPIMLDPRSLDNGYHLIMECTSAGASWYYAWYRYNSVRVTGSAYRIVVGSANEGYEDNPLEALIDPVSFECIDTENYKFYHNLISANIYVIVKTSLLSEANKNNFPSPGIYLERTENIRAKTALVYAYLVTEHQLKDRYIPSTIARTSYVDEKITETIPLPATASVGQTIVVSAVDENSKPTAWKMTYSSENSGSSGGEWTKLGDITVSNTFEFNPISFTGGVVTLDTNAEGYSFMNKTHTSVVFHSIDITANTDPVLYQLRPKDYTMGTFDVYNNDGVAQTSASIDLTKFKMSVMNIGEVSMTDIPDYDRYKVRFVFPTMATHGVRAIIYGNVNALTFDASVTLSKNGVIFENELLSFPYNSEYMVRKSSVNYGPFYGMNASTGYISVAIVQSGAGKTKPVNGVVKFSPSFCPFVNGSRFELWGANDV